MNKREEVLEAIRKLGPYEDWDEWDTRARFQAVLWEMASAIWPKKKQSEPEPLACADGSPCVLKPGLRDKMREASDQSVKFQVEYHSSPEPGIEVLELSHVYSCEECNNPRNDADCNLCEQQPQPKTCKCGRCEYRKLTYANIGWYDSVVMRFIRQDDTNEGGEVCPTCLCLLKPGGEIEQLYREGESLGEAWVAWDEDGKSFLFADTEPTLEACGDWHVRSSEYCMIEAYGPTRAGTCVKVRLVEVTT